MSLVAAELLAEDRQRRTLAGSNLVEELATLAFFDRSGIEHEDIEAVARFYCEPARGPSNDQVLMLSDHIRVEALGRVIDRGGMAELAAVRHRAEPFEPSPLQEMLDVFTLGLEVDDLTRLSDDHLVAALTVARWAAEAVALARLSLEIDLVFDSDQVEGLLARREVTRPVRELASEGCVAREFELERLRSYVNAPVVGTLGSDPALTVYGIGGVGKSTLVAAFVTELVDRAVPGRDHAWAYLDMDRPTLRSYRPDVILSEVLRQVAAQHPEGRRALEGQRRQVTQKSAGRGLESVFADSDFFTAVFELSEVVQTRTSEPLVVILDTFEEVEHTRPELREDIYRMFDSLSGSLPLKLIVSGRVPAQPFARDPTRSDRRLEVREFEGAQALQLLRHFLGTYPDPVGIDDDLGHEIVDTVGGNPLTLKLAASVLATEGTAGFDEVIDRARVVDNIRREFIRGFLYQRIIEHLQASNPINTKALQGVAKGSLPLRQVTPHLLEEVVLPALGISHDDPVSLYEELARTVAFVREDGERCWLRIEVRIPALRALGYADSGLVDRVHRRATSFYNSRTGDPSAALELAFHRLELGEAVDDLGLDPSALEGLKQWVTHPETVARAGARTDLNDEQSNTRLEQIYAVRQAVTLAEKAIGTGDFVAARTALEGLDSEAIKEAATTDPRVHLDLTWVDSRVHAAAGSLPDALTAAAWARLSAQRLADRVRYAAVSIWIASLQERDGEGSDAVGTLEEAVEAPLLAGDHRIRLELLLNQMTTLERLGALDEERRWRLELSARSLLGRQTPDTDLDTGLIRLLAATLGRDEPSRLLDAVGPVGLGAGEDPGRLQALASQIAKWDRDRSQPGILASALGIITSASRSAEQDWFAALAGMGPEAGFKLLSLWEIEQPPGGVREAIRAFYVWWEVERSAPQAAAAPSPSEERPHFLDETPIDFGREEIKDLEQIILDGYGKPEQLARLADLTGIDPARLDTRARPHTMVRGFLTTVSGEGRLRDLARVMNQDTSLGSLRAKVVELTGEAVE